MLVRDWIGIKLDVVREAGIADDEADGEVVDEVDDEERGG